MQSPAAEANPGCCAFIHTCTHGPFSATVLGMPSLTRCSPFQNPGGNPPAVFIHLLPSLSFSPQLFTEHENTAERTLFQTPGYQRDRKSQSQSLHILCQVGYVLQRKVAQVKGQRDGALERPLKRQRWRRDHHFLGKGTGKGPELKMYRRVTWSALCFKSTG